MTAPIERWNHMFDFVPSVSPDKFRTQSILVVEDNAILNQVLCDLLTEQGYDVMPALNGIEALEKLRKHIPDLLISDVVMPGMDGYELLEEIRSNPATFYLSVIFLTGHASAADRRRAKKLGVEEYLTKPLDTEDLVFSVRNAMMRQQATEWHIHQRVEGIRNQILGLMQHEFRTPLTLIMGYAEYLQELIDHQDTLSLDQADLHQSIQAILEGSQRLHHLIESFLTLATLSRETLPEEEIYPFDPVALWRESMGMQREAINASPLKILLLDPPDPVIAFGIMDLLREALSRLLENALTYRRPESKRVWLSVVTKPGFVGWQIQDEGIGISQKDLAALAEPFVRIYQPDVASPGAGLSLTLVRRIAELHGGTLVIESQEEQGSIFTLWIADREQ